MTAGLGNGLSLTIFETMTRIAIVDERIRGMLLTGEIGIVYYSPRGQELLAAAVAAATRPGDYTVTTYRGIHDEIAAGAPLRETIAEMLGRSGGGCKGKGGPMHISAPDQGVMVTTGIVGAGLPIANGLGLGAKLKGEDRVTICNFGDGASNIGAFHEALNLAAIWDLPVVFICQNNQYGEYTPRLESQRCRNVADRAASYGMVGVTANGNDALETYSAAKEAIDRARAGDGPTLLELNTYRFMGHVFGVDTMIYMPKDELAAAVAADPVPRFRLQLLDAGISESTLSDLEDAITADVDEAIEFALASPPAAISEAFTDVYAAEVRA